MHSKEKRILFLVEGASAEVKLFSKILDCYPEIHVEKQNIIVYKTNLFVLDRELTKEFGDDWYEEQIDFWSFLRNSPVTCQQITNLLNEQNITEQIHDFVFTDIFLVFDYERQEPLFDAERMRKMLAFWNESTENGLLYINYPMLEAYKHIKKPLPDMDYLIRKCDCTVLWQKGKTNKYKRIVHDESSYQNITQFTRNQFQHFVIHNLCKASAITRNTTDISEMTARQYWENINYFEILDVQNRCSQSIENGFVYVLATCLFFITEYNSYLVFNA